MEMVFHYAKADDEKRIERAVPTQFRLGCDAECDAIGSLRSGRGGFCEIVQTMRFNLELADLVLLDLSR